MLDFNQKADQQVVNLLKALGQAYLENGENQKASEKFRQLVNNGIVDPEIFQNFALSLARIESINDEAIAVYRNAVAAEENNETLYLSLSTLFLKKNITDDPALKVYRRSLHFSPPFQEEIRTALEKIFHETTDTITTPELRKTLLDSIENPDILRLYLSTMWNHSKYDEALYLLKDLYKRTNENPIYLEAICQTLLEKKAKAEQHGLKFSLKSADVGHCLKYKNINEPLNQIKEIELYLDVKNLFLCLSRQVTKPKLKFANEFESIISDKALNILKENAEDNNLIFEVDHAFSLVKDLIKKKNIKCSLLANDLQNDQHFANNNSSNSSDSTQILNQLTTLAIFEIVNYDSNPENSKLPFTTFINLIAGELGRSEDTIICTTEDGLISFGVSPNKLLKKALQILQKVDRFNQVVEEPEIIKLHVTLHYSEIPFLNLQDEGLKEIRKGFKVHNIVQNAGHDTRTLNSDVNCLITTDTMNNAIKGIRVNKLGEYVLPHFPGNHQIFELYFRKPAEKSKTETTHRFGKYEIVESVKENQLYSTYRGYDPQLERTVIIKAYKTLAFSNFKNFTQLRKQFHEEIRKLNRINHPNIGVIYDAGADGDILYLVREYCDGQLLNDYLLQNGLPEIHQVFELYLKICNSLAHYHHNQILHKNLKPANIFVTQHEVMKLTDGGLLQVRHTREVWKYDINSLAYSAPEQIQGIKLTQSCDIFQLGILLYESLTGIHPFRAKNASELRIRILADQHVAASKIRREIPEYLDSILNKALDKVPDKRYQSIQMFANELQALSV